MLIQADRLSKYFGRLCAVDNLSLQVGANEIYGLVGPDGAGKTTTLRLLCGALHASAGAASIAGYDIHRQIEQARAQIGYLPQRFSLYEDLTVLENIRFFAETRGLPPAEWRPRCMEILEFVGLDQYTGRLAGQLSGGMKQKLGLAAALVHRPIVLLLDEPTTGVDPVTRQDFWQLIIRLVAEEGVALLISTPYMDEAASCTRLGFMEHGRLVVEGTPAELRRRLDGRVLELSGQPLALLRKIAAGIEDIEAGQMFGDRMHLRIRKGKVAKVTASLKHAIPQQGGSITRLRAIPPQLEDVFIDLIERQDG